MRLYDRRTATTILAVLTLSHVPRILGSIQQVSHLYINVGDSCSGPEVSGFRIPWWALVNFRPTSSANVRVNSPWKKAFEDYSFSIRTNSAVDYPFSVQTKSVGNYPFSLRTKSAVYYPYSVRTQSAVDYPFFRTNKVCSRLSLFRTNKVCSRLSLFRTNKVCTKRHFKNLTKM